MEFSLLMMKIKSRRNNLLSDQMSNSTHPGRVVVQEDFHRGNHHNVTNRDVVLQQFKTFLLHRFRGSASYMVSGRVSN